MYIFTPLTSTTSKWSGCSKTADSDSKSESELESESELDKDVPRPEPKIEEGRRRRIDLLEETGECTRMKVRGARAINCVLVCDAKQMVG